MKLGIIGGGMISQSILRGIIAKNIFTPENIFVSEFLPARQEELKNDLHVHVTTDVNEFSEQVDILILAVKPKDVRNAIKDLKIKPETIFVSVAAGIKIESLEEFITDRKIIRVMPNVALSVGEGMSAMCPNANVTAEDFSKAETIFKSCGKSVRIDDERLMDAVTGLSGSAPAYAFLVIDALSDGGVASGLPRDVAKLLAAQTLFGAAKMVLESNEHPDALRDRVTSPAGTTIEGIRVLEQYSTRAAMIDAVIAGTEKSKQL